MRSLSQKAVREFQQEVYRYYRATGRSFLWRATHNSYHVLVSEVMLQQTQVTRVTPFFKRFLKMFPSVKSLAGARRSEVLRVWQGLGYNRRALNLHKTARVITEKYNGVIPRTPDELDALPGIGKYTAAAVCAFAFNMPTVFVETNIRTVYLYYFFKRHTKVSDADILSVVGQTLDFKNPREWYQALMDYGAMLKRTVGNENARSIQYKKQSRFSGSRREIRGRVLKLAVQGSVTQGVLFQVSKELKTPFERVQEVITELASEGFLRTVKGVYFLR